MQTGKDREYYSPYMEYRPGTGTAVGVKDFGRCSLILPSWARIDSNQEVREDDYCDLGEPRK